ncbi:hypothetical protein F5Y04DRAFT_282241 [Hypomontagnella monticulosa]|nr:hypothetical protein F5Y04DRAFT_282241 [Hypomontagnella monticulosa]
MEGYAKVAQLMATYEEFAILRRFKRLNYQNLLYLQAQIIHLEESLDRLVEQDAIDPERKEHARDWWRLAHGKGRAGRAQWRKVCRIRKKLKEYNEALLQQVQISKLDGPNPIDLEFLRSWFERPSMGWFPIRGLDFKAWEQRPEDDLIAVKPRIPPDPLSKWITNYVFPLYHRLFGVRFKVADSNEVGDGLYTYEESLLSSVISIITIVAASVLPLLSIVVLYVVETEPIRLGILIIFSSCFALALALMTSARKVEIFAATAAYAAVNVVFLTNND